MTTFEGPSARRTRMRAALFLLLCGTGAADVFAAPANAEPTRVPLLSAALPQAVSGHQAEVIEPLADDSEMKLAIGLTLRDPAGLEDFLTQLQDPASPNYHRYLSVEEFTARFAPTQSDYDAVVAWAAANGLTVTDRPRNRLLVDVRGSVDAINRALHVVMTSYRHPVESRRFFAPDREPSVNLTVPVLQIAGLDDFTLPQPRLRRGNPEQIARAAAAGSGPGGVYLPSDIRAAYYGSGPLDGAGQTVGIFSFDGYKPEDVALFYSSTGMSSNVPINNVLVNGFSGLCGDGGSGCDDGEQVLDIVNVIGMAPGIEQILFYEGDSGPDILNRMATDNLAKVLSCSWGSTDLGTANDPIFAEFQAQGQTFLNATGDNGAYNSATWLPPSLNSKILQVGGTDLVTTGSGGAWSAESGWPDSGGGYYQPAGYPIPSYQKAAGVITVASKGSTTYRNDPDVAAEADFDNPTVSNGQFQTGFGGTSFAAPRWAGFIALANEQAIANGSATMGFVNPAIYTIGRGATYANDFHDVTSGQNKPSSGSGAGFNAVAKYDLVTGWGSPRGANLIGALSGSTTAAGYVLSSSPPAISMLRSSSMPTTIAINALNGFSGAVSLSASGLPSGVSAVFSPASTSTQSTLTLTASGSAALGTSKITIKGVSAGKTRTMTMSLFVGNAPSASLDQNAVTFAAVVPHGAQSQTLTLSNAANSVPLSYNVAAYASTNGACSGSVAWLAVLAGNGDVNGGENTSVTIDAVPGAASLAPGNYAAELCFTTNDTAHAKIVVPVHMTVIAGPALDTIFLGGFETGDNGGAGIVTFSADMPVENDQAGSALDLATGNYHTWNAADLDNINLYNDSASGLSVYWYNDVVSTPFDTQVGGVVSGGEYAVLQPGATIGPASTFSNSVTAMTNWQAGADGYIGVAFLNEQTNALNYGYIHVTTTAPLGFPAQVLEYGFDSTGAAIRIP